MRGSKSNLYKHGRQRTSEWFAWQSMKRRCLDPKHPWFTHYGGRGITICAEWCRHFPIFLQDMGLKPTSKHTLERIDNNGNYEPSNCRWATRKEQAANRKRRSPYALDSPSNPLSAFKSITVIYGTEKQNEI
jgi:hypothetical protein